MRKIYNGNMLVEEWELEVGDKIRVVDDGQEYLDEHGCNQWHVTDIEGIAIELMSLNGDRRYMIA